jgi:hypothetical protein
VLPGWEERAKARQGRYDRFRKRRVALVIQAASIARQPITRAIPVHSHNPAIETIVGLLEIVLLIAALVTGSVVVMGAFLVSVLAFFALHVTDTRAVIALDDDGRGALLAAGGSGRPTSVIGPASVDEPLPAAPTGLSARIRVSGRTWWIDRSSYRALTPTARPSAEE